MARTRGYAWVDLELEGCESGEEIIGALRSIAGVRKVELHDTFTTIFGKQVIIMGGEANLAGAVEAVARLPHTSILVLTESIMGGEIMRGQSVLSRRKEFRSSASGWWAMHHQPSTSS